MDGLVSFNLLNHAALKDRMEIPAGLPLLSRSRGVGICSNPLQPPQPAPTPTHRVSSITGDSAVASPEGRVLYAQTPLFPCCSQRTAKPALKPFQNPARACRALGPSATWLPFHMKVWDSCGDERAVICAWCYLSPQHFALLVKERVQPLNSSFLLVLPNVQHGGESLHLAGGRGRSITLDSITLNYMITNTRKINYKTSRANTALRMISLDSP